MNRRKFVEMSSIGTLAAVSAPRDAMAAMCLSCFDNEQRAPLSAAEISAFANAGDQVILLNQNPANLLELQTETQVITAILTSFGGTSKDVEIFQKAFYDLGDFSNWAGVCFGAVELGSTRLGELGAVVLRRYCIGFGWTFMAGWNVGTYARMIMKSGSGWKVVTLP